MRRQVNITLLRARRRSYTTSPSHKLSQDNLIQIRDGTFYRDHPSSLPEGPNTTSAESNVLFPNLDFILPATPQSHVGQPQRMAEHWAVIASSGSPSTFLQILQGQYLCLPPKARTYPYLSSSEIQRKNPRLSLPSRAIQYVGFSAKSSLNLSAGGGGTQGAYLSARYESRREETDWSVLSYLRNETDLNPNLELKDKIDDALLDRVIQNLRLQKLLSMPVSNLSNGQTRRARIAKALMSKPELLILDEPFMGLDPPTLVTLSPMLKGLSWRSEPLLILGLRVQDPVPDWITHLVVVNEANRVVTMGGKEDVLFRLGRWADIFTQYSTSSSIRGAEVDKTSRQTAALKTIRRGLGEPVTGIGDTLTEKGIRAYDAYARARESSSKYFDGIFVKPHVLDSDKKEIWDVTNQKRTEELTLEDWLVLTSSVPSELKTDGQSSSVSSHTPHTSPMTTKPTYTPTTDTTSSQIQAPHNRGEPLIDLESITVKYGDKTVLGHPTTNNPKGGLNLTIRRSTRLALLGPNGSGKTTLLSLLTSDHPQSYSLPIRFFGRTRLPTKGIPGLSLWEIQSRIGHSSPEVHQFFPKTFSVRRVLESAWADTFSSKPDMTESWKSERIDRWLRWWEPELRQDRNSSRESLTTSHDGDEGADDTTNTSSIELLMTKGVYPPFPTSINSQAQSSDLSWASDRETHRFNVLPLGTQRLLLLLRSLIKDPDILILDEAFSGLSLTVREKAMAFLEEGETAFIQKATSEQIQQYSTSNDGIVRARNKRVDIVKLLQQHGVTNEESMTLDTIPAHLKSLGQTDLDELLNSSSLAGTATSNSSNDNSSTDKSIFKGLTPNQAMVIVSHIREEIPPTVTEWIRLPSEEEVIESGKDVLMGRCDATQGGAASIRSFEGWNQVWGL